MAIVTLLYAVAIFLLLMAGAVWAASRHALQSKVQAGAEEELQAPAASIVEQLERQYRNSPSYHADP